MNIKIFADGADLNGMLEEYKRGVVSGFTTNPSLMKKAGVTNYREFVEEVVKNINMPVSFEVFSDDFNGMRREALELSKLGDNIYVKIPVTNTKGESTVPLIEELSERGYKLNITAIFTVEQVKKVLSVLRFGTPSIISVFAGRIADAGVDPEDIMKESKKLCERVSGVELLWASCRELYNIVQAEKIGVDIITVPYSLLKKLNLFGKDLEEFSLETIKGFYKDASGLGFTIL